MEGTENSKPYESATEQVCINIQKKKKKDGGKEEKKKDKDVFPGTADLELRRRRRMMGASGEEDELVSQKQFCFQLVSRPVGKDFFTIFLFG